MGSKRKKKTHSMAAPKASDKVETALHSTSTGSLLPSTPEEGTEPGGDYTGQSRGASHSIAASKEARKLDSIIRKEALLQAVEKLTRSGEVFLNLESIFTSLQHQKTESRKKLRSLQQEFENNKTELQQRAFMAPEGMSKIKAMQRLTEAQFSYCCEFSCQMQLSQCSEFDILSNHMSEAMKTMHDSMLITMQLVQTHCDQQQAKEMDNQHAMNARILHLENQVARLTAPNQNYQAKNNPTRSSSQERGRATSRYHTGTLALPAAGRDSSARSASRAISEERLALATAQGYTPGRIRAAQEISAFNKGYDSSPWEPV